MVNWIEADLNESLQSIVRNTINDWRRKIYVSRDKSDVSPEDQVTTYFEDIKVKNIKKKKEIDESFTRLIKCI